MLIRHVLVQGCVTDEAMHNLRMASPKFEEQFPLYGEHDAQELLTFLQNGLHEDMNRAAGQPHIPVG